MKCWKTWTKTLSRADFMSGLFLCSSLSLFLSRLFLARFVVQVSGLSEGRAPFCTPLQAVYRSRSILFFPRSVDRKYEFHVYRKRLFLPVSVTQKSFQCKIQVLIVWLVDPQTAGGGSRSWSMTVKNKIGTWFFWLSCGSDVSLRQCKRTLRCENRSCNGLTPDGNSRDLLSRLTAATLRDACSQSSSFPSLTTFLWLFSQFQLVFLQQQ